MTEVSFRLARADDLPLASRLFVAAQNELSLRRGLTLFTDPDARTAVYRHHLAVDPARFWVAERDGHVAGFSVGSVRGRLWFLSALFVHPEAQGRGLGRALLERAIDGYPRAGGIAATISEAAQPVSTTLYARHGMRPWLPVVAMTGRPRLPLAPPLGALDARPLTLDDLPELCEIDAAVTGVDRGVDHPGYAASDRRGWLFTRGGRPVGYAYTSPSGLIGPAAALRPQDMDPVMRWALADLAGSQAAPIVALLPGPSLHAQQVLWEAGLVADERPGLLLVSRPFGRFDRYAFGSYALM
jgi:GNAT superfamily N-acetyltransferase